MRVDSNQWQLEKAAMKIFWEFLFGETRQESHLCFNSQSANGPNMGQIRKFFGISRHGEGAELNEAYRCHLLKKHYRTIYDL